MAYMALYRAYRPQKFSEVVGQQHIIKTLQNAISLNKVAHAYLFCGPRGTGKTTLAKIMAKALNCENGPTIEPCDECEICKGIQKGTISDVIEIDAASNNGADDIRALRDTVKFMPAVGKYKVYIIDEVHMLSNAAFNALLKTLEEPPKHIVFILATTEPYKLPNTILSRCQRFDFQSISMEDILKRLEIVAKEEHILISSEAMVQIATSAEGGMRDALSLFDQCISYSTHSEITLDDVLAVSGNVSYLKIIELLNSCVKKKDTEAVIFLDKMVKEGKEIPRIMNDLILFLRDMLLYKNQVVLEQKPMFKNQEFIELSTKVSKPLIYQWLDILNDSLNQMRFSTQKRAYAELAILKMSDYELNAQADFSDRIESLEHTIAILNEKIEHTSSIEEKKPYVPPLPTTAEMKQFMKPKEENKQIEIVSSNEITIKDVENVLYHASKEKKEKLNQIWKQISMSDQYSNTFAIQILINGKIVAVSDDAFIVELPDMAFCNRVMQYENYVKIMEIFNEYDLNIKDYICIPTVIWSKILSDYKSKYSKDNPQPKLADIKIGIKRRVIPNEPIKKEDPIITQLKQYFNEEQLKITED